MPDGLKRFILWDYPRASWQYDVMVGIILAFIFLTPRAFFRDQPRVSSVVALSSEQGARVFYLEAGLFNGVPSEAQEARAAELVRGQAGSKEKLVRLTPIFDSEEKLKGYMAYTRP